MTTPQQMRHAGARHKSEKPSWTKRSTEKTQSPERSSRREKVARALGMLATIGATLTAATGISVYRDSGSIEPVGNLLNPVAEHVLTTDEDIATTDGLSNIIALEGRQAEETRMHYVTRFTEAAVLSVVALRASNGWTERKRKKGQS
ncbi:hypothetical protein HG437_004400 [Candidatus Saccharibacteria bacterium]|nr:hypothetical protein [Candidatus Saccharibacteria bacterium]